MIKTPLTEIERSIVEKLSHARFPPATASKRIVRDLASGRVQNLSGRGREFLAFVAHRFRRQWKPTAAELAWVRAHLAAPAPANPARLTRRSQKVPREHQLPPRAEFPDAAKWLGGSMVDSERPRGPRGTGKAGTASRTKNVSGAADSGESRRGGTRAVSFADPRAVQLSLF